ncbi:MAG TPA: hypothetical protein VMV05_09215, partial [bacterium]|nr:hypothetical protein [bacterium]
IGIATHPTEYVGYSNVLLGYLLERLFSWFPLVPWYGMFLFAVQLFSSGSMLWLICRDGDKYFRLLLFIGAWFGVYFLFFAFLQFDMTAVLAAQAGILLFAFSMEALPPGERSGPLLFSTALLFLSGLIRFEAPFLVFLLFLPWWASKAVSRETRRGFFGGKFWASLVVLAFSALWIFQFAWFQRDGRWREFADFDHARVTLQDYRILRYSPETQPVFKAVGWTENDLWLFKNWFLADSRKYNSPVFQALAGRFPRFGSEGKTASFHSLPELIGSAWDRRILLYCLAFLALCPVRSWRVLVPQGLWLLALLWFLIYVLRAPDRLTLPLEASVMGCYLLNSRTPFSPDHGPVGLNFYVRMIRFLALVFLFLAPFSAWEDQMPIQHRFREAEKRMHESIRRLSPKDDQLFVTWSFPYEAIGAFDDLECFRHFHVFPTTFFQTCPATMELAGEFGVHNPFRDVVDNPRVFLNCSQEEGLHFHDYLAENYGLDAGARKIFDCELFKIYAIHSVEKAKGS